MSVTHQTVVKLYLKLNISLAF